ncbi:MAG: PEGA domain-containing protein [Myxococcota bacterium]
MTPVLIALVLAQASPSSPPGTVFLDELRNDGSPADTADVEAAIREALEQAGFLVTGRSDLARDLQERVAAQSMDECADTAQCIADLQQAVDADRIVIASVGAVGTSTVLFMTLIDTKKASPLARESEIVPPGEPIAPAVKRLVRRTFNPTAEQQSYSLPDGKATSFAILDLRADGVAPEVAANLTEVLSTEVKRIKNTTVISRDDVKSMLELESAKQELGCDDTSCLAEIAGALGVEKMIVGNVGKLGTRYVLGLRLLDSKRAEAQGRVSETLRGDEAQLIPAVRSASRRLLGIEVEGQGSLAVTSSEEAAEVVVDNAETFTLPAPPLNGLNVGKHSLVVRKPGYVDYFSDIYIDPNQTTVVWAPLVEEPVEWYRQWWVWTGIGVVVAGGITTAILLSSDSESGTGSVMVR